jgi:4-hydroxybenzoate polyprenyltransferase/phosphoserine phosphatase
MLRVDSQLLRPLCVDLDDCLIRSDLLLEAVLLLLKRNPAYVLLALTWLVRGKAVFKAEVARRVQLNPAALPYSRELLDWLRSERSRGRHIWLCTAANESLARAVATHLGIFNGVIASDASVNLIGRVKADRLVGSFGYRNFDYCGNERGGVPIWASSSGAIVVNAEPALAARAAGQVPLLHTIPGASARWRALLRALRPHQWAKNALLFVPLLAAHRAGDLVLIGSACVAFVAFSLCASAVYVLNDMLDLEADRAHARKSKRPFASGDLPLAAGFGLIPALLAGAVLAAIPLPGQFQLTLAGYALLTSAYSLGLKGMVLIDALALAGLYTLRVIAGAAAVSVPLSFWLLLFSLFLFLSLALVKRYAELDALRRRQQLEAAGRGYHVEDLPMLEALGISAGYLSVLVLALYINSPATVPLYRHPQAIWPLCFLLLYWVTRLWMKTHRGRMHDDPVVFALSDRVSLLTGLLAALTVGLAI